MEGDSSFIAALTEAIEQRHRQIENTELPRLKEQFQVFHASTQSLMSILVRKGLIQEDPYKSEQKISGLTLPDDTEFQETERAVIVGVRFSQFDNVLEYATNYVEFTVDKLSFTELKKLNDLVRYIAWDDLKQNSPKPTTRAIWHLMGKMKVGTDSFSSGIINNSMNQLADGCRAIISSLKTVREFQRERYKLDLRTMVFPQVESADTLKAGDPESLKRVKAVFAQSGMSGPYLPELVSEVVAEDYGPDSDAKRRSALQRLQEKSDSKGRKKAAPVSLAQLLVDGIRSLAASSRALDGALERLRENAAVLESRKRGLASRLREWLEKVMNRKATARIYELEFMDEATGTKHRESVDLDAFLEKLHKKAQLYASILSRDGGLWTKIEKASEDQLYKYLTQELGDLHLIHRRALAFDGYFKGKSDQDEKKKLRGIKIELTTIRNSIAKSSRIKHEYSSRREERDQMKKLGIEGD